MIPAEGYLYIATGHRYIEELKISAGSLKRCNPKAHISLVTDRQVDIAEIDHLILLEIDKSDPKGSKNYKAQGMLHTPYERTLYIDTDTWFIEGCTELFPLLEYHDMLIAHSPGDQRLVTNSDRVLWGYLGYNAGVIAYRKSDAIESLFKAWYLKCRENVYRGDQPPLMDALLEHRVKIYVLQPHYNLRLPFLVSVPGFKVKILHGRHRDFEKVAGIVNKDIEQQRVWNPNTGKMLVRIPERSKALRNANKRKKKCKKKRKSPRKRLNKLYRRIKRHLF